MWLPFVLFAQSNIFSNIPPVSIEVINLNPESCDESCLFELSNEGKVFSFIARFDTSIKNPELQNIMESYAKEIGMYYRLRMNPLGEKLQVALLMPKKIIGKYSATTIDTILAYLLARDVNFRFKIFDSINEDLDSLYNAVNKINDEQFDFVIAILSQKESLEVLEKLNIPVYVPTMNNKNIQSRGNVFFGGIDYELQIKKLITQKEQGITLIYNDDSLLGQNLGATTLALNDWVLTEVVITNKVAANFSKELESEEMFLAGSNVFLNTPVVKSGLLLSQIGILTQQPAKILSTQVNYNPALLSLVRGNNTNNIIIANSISQTHEILLEYGLLLSSDMQYDWVNYSTALGMDFFISKMSSNIQPYFSEEFVNNQAMYHIHLYGIKNGIFAPLQEK